MNKKILITIGILVIAVVLLVGCIQGPKPATTTTTTIATECGNNLCESGECDSCPEDCEPRCVLPSGLSPEAEKWYTEMSEWLDKKLVEWKPTEYKPMKFVIYHSHLSNKFLIPGTNSSDDLKFLDVADELGADMITIHVRAPEQYSEFELKRIDRVFSEIHKRNITLKIWYDGGMEDMTKEEYHELAYNSTEYIIKRWHPDYYSIIHEPATREWAYGFHMSKEEWQRHVSIICNLTKSLDPDVITTVTVINNEWEMKFIDYFVKISNLDIIGFDIYGNWGREDSVVGLDIIGQKIDLIHSYGKKVSIEETWLSLAGYDGGFFDSKRAWWDLRWIKVITYYAQNHNVELIEPFYSTQFILYPDYVAYHDLPQYIDDYKTALHNERRTSPFCAYKDVIEEVKSHTEVVCGNGVCESGEDGHNCPVDCCVSGDGLCPVGCTSARDDDCKTGNLSEVRVAVLYEYVTDGAFIGRSPAEVLKIFNETRTDLIFRGWWRWSPCPESPDVTEIPPGYPEWYLDYTERRAKEGYTYQQLREAINEIKKDNPDVIFCGAIPAQRVTQFAWNPMTEEFIEYPETWEMALDPGKWGIPESKEDFQKRFAIWHGWIEGGEEYDPKQVSSYYPDITNEKFQELFLSWAKKQIDCGADAIWIDMLFGQAKMLAKITRDLNHSAVKESFEAASKMVDEIHKYGESKGKHIYIGSWGSSIIYPYPRPDLDFITASPSSKEVYLMELNRTYWDIVTTAVKEKLGDIPFFVFIDWAVSTRDPLGVFSHYLTTGEQREFLGIADEFFQEKGINFIYPVHGGWMGYDTKIFSFGKSSFYDSLAPEFETYETIKELAQNKSKSK